MPISPLRFPLGKDGLFKSWAIPKGIPDALGIKRLAVQVDDHELTFGDFEGTLPQGQYGAGKIRIWDSGTYEMIEWLPSKITFLIFGKITHGAFMLVRFSDPNSQSGR
jgi:DNA ligase D-like protein (predicted 3'-phosphoesterase)